MKYKCATFTQQLVLLALALVVISCNTESRDQTAVSERTTAQEQQVPKKRILFVNSYDLDSVWAKGTLIGALDVLGIKIDNDNHLDDSESPISFKLYNMNTKKIKSIEHKQKAAVEAKSLIDSWKPDVVICADDNASKYLIVPYFMDSGIPFVFCGVNWSAEAYGFPSSNVTGMIEVFPVAEALNILKPYIKGDRIGFLVNDTLSERKNGKYIKEIFKLNLIERYVTSLDEFEHAYKELQTASDLLIVIEVSSLKGFDEKKFYEITHKHIQIPTVSFANLRAQNFLLICKRVPEEQGEWAALAALDILNGKAPSDIPMAMNKKAAIRLNMKLAKRLGIQFPMDLIQRATFVSEENTQ